jgi:Ca-activated chloride channel homolog
MLAIRKSHAFVFAVLLFIILAPGRAAHAQSSLDEVHIVPRVTPAASAVKANQLDPALDAHSPAVKKDVDLVLVPVTITDPMGRLVSGLGKDNFQIFDGKQQQEIRHFSSEDGPVSLGIIFDMSGSMKDKLSRAQEAVAEFCRIANPQDEFFMVTFSDAPRLDVDFTPHVDEIQNALAAGQAKGRTALLDAIYLGLTTMRQAKYQKKALLIISDGGDNRSRYTENEIKSLVKEADVLLYAVGIYDRNFATPEELLGPQLLQELVGLTGGRAFALENVNDLPVVAESIGTELRNQYLLAYRPEQAARDGKWHKIRIKMRTPKGWPSLLINAKTGYYAAGR